MEAFPADIRAPDGERPSGLICPDCGGSISVSVTDGLLVFRCRVGHLYSVDDVLVGKEAHIEHTMCAAVHAYAEMAAFLRTLGQRDRATPIADTERARRAEQAEANARALRGILENDRRILLPEPLDDRATGP